MHAHALNLQEPTGGTRLVSLVKWPAQPGLRDKVRLSRWYWYLGGSQRFRTAGITWFQHLHEHLPAGGALCGHDHEFVGMPNEVQFRSSSTAATTS